VLARIDGLWKDRVSQAMRHLGFCDQLCWPVREASERPQGKATSTRLAHGLLGTEERFLGTRAKLIDQGPLALCSSYVQEARAGVSVLQCLPAACNQRAAQWKWCREGIPGATKPKGYCKGSEGPVHTTGQVLV